MTYHTENYTCSDCRYFGVKYLDKPVNFCFKHFLRTPCQTCDYFSYDYKDYEKDEKVE